MFEELALLVEVFDGVGMVGAWTIHEFVEVVRQLQSAMATNTVLSD